jgi:hypothetical protein
MRARSTSSRLQDLLRAWPCTTEKIGSRRIAGKFDHLTRCRLLHIHLHGWIKGLSGSLARELHRDHKEQTSLRLYMYIQICIQITSTSTSTSTSISISTDTRTCRHADTHCSVMAKDPLSPQVHGVSTAWRASRSTLGWCKVEVAARLLKVLPDVRVCGGRVKGCRNVVWKVSDPGKVCLFLSPPPLLLFCSSSLNNFASCCCFHAEACDDVINDSFYCSVTPIGIIESQC